MRPDKQFLADEIKSHLQKSDYTFVVDFERLDVEQTAELRTILSEKDGAEFHVVKNTVLNVALKQLEMTDLSEHLTGQNAIVVGGDNAPGVAKALLKFHKDKDKLAFKGGIFSGEAIGAEQAKAISELPTLEEARTQLVSLLQTPAQQLVMILNAPARDLVNIFGGVETQYEGVENMADVVKQAAEKAAA